MRKLCSVTSDGIKITAGKIVLTLNHGISTYELIGYARRQKKENDSFLCLYAESQPEKQPVMIVPLELVKSLTVTPLP